MRFTGNDEVASAATFGALITAGAVPMTRSWREERRYRHAQRLYERGVRGIPGLIAAVPAAQERTAALEADIGTLKADVRMLRDSVDYLIGRVEKLFPNGRDTNNPGDLMARMAEANGTWIVGHVDEPPRNRRAQDREPPA